MVSRMLGKGWDSKILTQNIPTLLARWGSGGPVPNVPEAQCTQQMRKGGNVGVSGSEMSRFLFAIMTKHSSSTPKCWVSLASPLHLLQSLSTQVAMKQAGERFGNGGEFHTVLRKR
jgi:hypothetical protein